MNGISKYLGELHICWGRNQYNEKADFMGSARNFLLLIASIVSHIVEASYSCNGYLPVADGYLFSSSVFSPVRIGLFHCLSYSRPRLPLTLVLVSLCSIVSPTCFSVLHSLWYSYLCVPLPFLLLSLCFTVCCSYPSVPLPLYVWLCVSLSLCSTVSLLLLPLYSFACHIFISELHCLILLSTCSIAYLLISVFYCLRYCYPCVSLPLYLYIRPILPLVLLSLCSFASLLIPVCSTAFAVPISRVPSPVYLTSLCPTASFPPVPVLHCLYYFYLVLHCLYYSSARASLPLLFISLCSITCTSHILIFHRLCYLYP